MDQCKGKDKKFASISDAFVLLVGKIIAAVRDTDGFEFSAKLLKLHDDECWFETRSGIVFMLRREDIRSIRQVVPRRP